MFKKAPVVHFHGMIKQNEKLFMILPVLPASELKLYWTIYSDDEERKKEPINPHDVIDDFFTVYKLEGIRAELWGLLKFAIENGSIPGNSNLISDFVLLYEKLNDLITANYILHMDKQPTDEKIADTS